MKLPSQKYDCTWAGCASSQLAIRYGLANQRSPHPIRTLFFMTLSESDNDHRQCRNGQQLKDLGLRRGYGGESGIRAARRKREEKTCDYGGIH
jgi:hypothetical protein